MIFHSVKKLCGEIEFFRKHNLGVERLSVSEKLYPGVEIKFITEDPLSFPQNFHLWVSKFFAARSRRKHGLRRNAAKKKRWNQHFVEKHVSWKNHEGIDDF